MKKLKYGHIFFLILCLILTIKIQAQKPAFETGKHIPPPEARSKKNFSSTLIYSTPEEFLVADRMKHGQVYTSYDALTLKKKETFTLEIPTVSGGKEVDWIKRLFRAEETTSIYGYYNRKEDENIVYGKITDRNGKDIVKEKVLAKITASKRKYIGSLGQVFSKDKSKILIYREITSKESEQEEIELWLYDDQLNKIYKKKMSFPYANKQFYVQEYLVTNDGKVIVIAYYKASKEEIKADPDAKNTLNFKVFGVTADNEELDEIKITKKGNALSSAFGWVLDSGDIVFSGFYRESEGKKYQWGINGIYYVKVNTNNWEIETSHFNKIPKEDLTRIFQANAGNERQKRRVKKSVDDGAGLTAFYFSGLFYENDGSVKIIAQAEWMTRVCTTDPKTGAQNCTYVYYNMQIVEFDLDAEGNLTKTLLIPKKQVAGSPLFEGHLSLLSSSRTYFIFNDADLNFNEKKLAKHNGNKFYYPFGKGRKNRLVYTYVKKNGDAVKVAMIDNYKNNILIYPRDFIRVNDQTVITWGLIRKGKELLLVKLYLKEKEKKD